MESSINLQSNMMDPGTIKQSDEANANNTNKSNYIIDQAPRESMEG